MKPRCSVPNCDSLAATRGWCKPHYDAFLRTGDPTSYRGDRSGMTLWEKVQEIGWTRDPATGCNEWNGYRNNLGYGQFREGKPGRLLRVHRIVYAELVGPLLPHENVLHSCDNPPCSEPSHLTKGDQAANMRAMKERQRGRAADWTHCPNGHEYPPDRPSGSAHNRCPECSRERNRRYQARKAA